MRPTLLDQSRLLKAGWNMTLSGRWSHPDLTTGPLGLRRRVFALDAALSLLDADPTQPHSVTTSTLKTHGCTDPNTED